MLGFCTLAFSLTVKPALSVAHACSCAAEELEPAFERADDVFEGFVHAVREEAGHRIVELEVVRTWKGADRERLELRTAGDEARCGYPFTQGQSYLVFTDRADDAIQAGLCSRTRPIAEASEDIATLGEGVTPVEPQAEEWEQVEKIRANSDEARPITQGSLPPSRGGCASCSLGAPPTFGPRPWLVGVALCALVRARRRRATRA